MPKNVVGARLRRLIIKAGFRHKNRTPNIKEFAHVSGLPYESMISITTGRRRLTPQTAERYAAALVACGVTVTADELLAEPAPAPAPEPVQQPRLKLAMTTHEGRIRLQVMALNPAVSMQDGVLSVEFDA